MTITSAPERAETDPRVEPGPGEALIDEAKQRARARHRRFGVLAVGTMVIAVAATVVAMLVNGSGTVSRERPVMGDPAGAVAGALPVPVNPQELVASWGGYHE